MNDIPQQEGVYLVNPEDKLPLLDEDPASIKLEFNLRFNKEIQKWEDVRYWIYDKSIFPSEPGEIMFIVERDNMPHYTIINGIYVEDRQPTYIKGSFEGWRINVLNNCGK